MHIIIFSIPHARSAFTLLVCLMDTDPNQNTIVVPYANIISTYLVIGQICFLHRHGTDWSAIPIMSVSLSVRWISSYPPYGIVPHPLTWKVKFEPRSENFSIRLAATSISPWILRKETNNEFYEHRHTQQYRLALQKGLEPPTYRVEAGYSIQLSYWSILNFPFHYLFLPWYYLFKDKWRHCRWNSFISIF